MASYISSSANRFYVSLESSYGLVGAISASSRIAAVKLNVQHLREQGDRKDKTGSRTFTGSPSGGRRRTEFDLRTYLTGWDKSQTGPGYGPLFQAALGGAPQWFGGGAVASSTGDGRIALASPHGLTVGQAVSSAGEIRFVMAVVDANTVQLNAPFVVLPVSGAAVGATITYRPATELPSVSIFDCWSPQTAVQRLLCGAGVDQLEIAVNGDYHELHFSGLAQDVLDTSSFSEGAGQLQSFPGEPELDAFDYAIVPGNMGQAWLGTAPAQFLTITSASVVLKNGLDTRSKEFGSNVPRAISAGQRSITAAFDLYAQDDEATSGLYAAARQESPISVMLQLGELEGQVMGVYLASVIPEVPEFDDSENRLQWSFRASRAQGTVDDEIAVAFG